MGKINLSEQQNAVLKKLGKVLFILALVALELYMFYGCKSLQSQTQVNYRDTTSVHTVIDTIRITITDTIHVEVSSGSESESETVIQFGSGGGTYNASTGEATNVDNIKQKNKDKEYQQTITSQAHIINYQSVFIDSLCEANKELQETILQQQNTKDITPRSGWDRFTTWWFIGSCTILLLLLAYAAWRIYRKFFLHV